MHIDEKCIGWGLCKNNCPADAIELQMKKPVWIKNECVMCLRCLHLCPNFAIQYDNRTKNHGQYLNPHIDSLD
ncbi:EFR1 family ferrodoxin [Methanobrevibacter sp. TLL-48-HuF1]|uniref:EFR1 family ferrodoxin n=1 Tax=Methanobrevibacter sp. TLL-48-HuF1 TaxID=2870563 RepID=UPI002026D64F|nr:EFR1 family ferrodoxin [Methanobrevibacter sp. TLL-48-HuF1]